jgi:hypothetical protein
MEPKLFTLDEAQRLVPRLQPLLEELRGCAQRAREAAAQVSVLVQQHGETGVDKPENPDRARYWAAVAEGRAAEERLQLLADEVGFLGGEVKDADLGLVDFRSRRGGEVVNLCWRLGEARIAHWHGLQEGFAGRKPLRELERRQR